MNITISISLKKIVLVLVASLLVLTGLSIIATVLSFISFSNPLLLEIGDSYIRLFYVDLESNIPTWFSASLLLVCSFLLAIITVAKKRVNDRYFRYWLGLSIIFLYLSIDESAIIHEMGITVVGYFVEAEGLFYNVWIIPGLAFILILTFIFFYFLLNLPSNIRLLFILSGIIYVAGVIFFESLSGLYTDLYTEASIQYHLAVTAEEFMEMLGLVIFIYALLLYLKTDFEKICVHSIE